jgi:phosphoribosylanthranilate isomerase
MRVKVCGITCLEDALAAAGAGADALGFVFAVSPRRVTPEKARAIINQLPPLVSTVGVFVNAAPSYIRRVRSFCGLDMVQLHGDESEAAAAALGPRVIKAVRLGKGRTAPPGKYPAAVMLLDTADDAAAGGTGRAFDWSLAVETARRRPVILAGGLNPDNVGRALNIVKPFAVDVCSGVESRPGRKDHDKIASFVARAKSIDLAA